MKFFIHINTSLNKLFPCFSVNYFDRLLTSLIDTISRFWVSKLWKRSLITPLVVYRVWTHLKHTSQYKFFKNVHVLPQAILCKKRFCLFPIKNLQAQLHVVQNTIDSAEIIYYCQEDHLPSQHLVSLFNGTINSGGFQYYAQQLWG